VTRPAVDAAQSGEAVDAVRTLQAELRNDYTEIRSAEIQLADAILSAHAVTMSGRDRLRDIQRQLIEAINSPAAALSTPAGERQFLMFLRGKIGEIQDIVDTGALSDEDHARLTRALGSGYLVADPAPGAPQPAAPSTGAPTADQAAGMVPALGSALGPVPQAAQGAAAGPAQGASGVTSAATPLAGLASDLSDGRSEPDPGSRHGELDDVDDADNDADNEADDVEERPSDSDDETDDGERARGMPPHNQKPPDAPPAQTRPAVFIEEHP
jgi:hypothetical protein